MHASDHEINAGLELIDSLGDTGAQMADIGQQLITCNREMTGDNLVGASAQGVADFEATINGTVQAAKKTRERVINHLDSSWTPR